LVARRAPEVKVTSREVILDRVRTALLTGPPADEPIPRTYLRRHAESDLISLFAERLADYRATVSRVALAGVPGAIATTAARLQLAEIAVAPGFPPLWLPDDVGARFLVDDPPLGLRELDRCGAALTTAAAGIALTGTVVLDARPGQGRRALTLIPDVHVCVLRAEQIAADVPDALAHLDPVRPLTFISGPSATSDIELQRVEGVHGPRTLHVIIAEGDAS
jgi:L-lactate dehydrogenase complex protein LldG